MIELKTPSIQDTELVLSWANKDALAEYFRRYPPTMDWGQPEQVQTALGWGYTIWEEGQAVGLIQVLNPDMQAKTVEVAMMVDRDRGKNRYLVSQVAYRQIADYLFNYLGYRKLYMKTLTHRKGLKKRLERGGWRLEAELRESCLFKGEYVNEWVLGLMKQDYLNWRNK